MPENTTNTTNTPNEAVPTTEVADTPTRRTRIKPRRLEDILNTKPVRLTETEKIILIEYLQEECIKYQTQAECFKNNAEAALKKASHFEGLLQHQNTKFFDIQQTMAVAYKAINNIVKETN